MGEEEGWIFVPRVVVWVCVPIEVGCDKSPEDDATRAPELDEPSLGLAERGCGKDVLGGGEGRDEEADAQAEGGEAEAKGQDLAKRLPLLPEH